MGGVVWRYRDIFIIIITFPYNYTLFILALFLVAASLLLCSFLNVFRSCLCYFLQYSKRCSKNI